MFQIDDLIVHSVFRGTLFDKASGDVLFSIDQIKEPALEISGETVYKNDALGSRIASFDRSKNATFSANNALFNLGLMAAQLGSDKQDATNENPIVVPKLQILDAETDSSDLVLKLAKTPTGITGAEISSIYVLNSNKTMGKKYEIGSDPAVNFSLNGKKITLPTDPAIREGQRFAVWYEYLADGAAGNGATEIINSAKVFAKGGIFDLEVLICEPCDINTLYHAHIVFGNAKMSNNVTLTLDSEADHPFSIECMQDYCADENELFKIVVSE